MISLTQLQKTARSRAALGRLLCFVLLFALSVSGFAAEDAPTNSPATKTEEAAPSQELRVYLQLQEQLHATQLAIERTRKEAAELSAQNNETLAARLQAIEQALSAQRARELEAMQNSNKAMQSSNKVMLTVAGAFASMGFLAMLLMGYFQWKTINRLAEISTALPGAGYQLPAARPLAALGPAHSEPIVSAQLEQTNSALLESVHRLEKRLYELEHSTPSPQNQPEVDGEAKTSTPANGSTDIAAATDATKITLLLNKGQSLLNMDKTEEALECFDSVLAVDVHNPEALVKKGTALEKLRKLEEAIECYDQAIAADGTMTIAYLYKGGVFNRMEKFSEALECYEQALRTQEKRRA